MLFDMSYYVERSEKPVSDIIIIIRQGGICTATHLLKSVRHILAHRNHGVLDVAALIEAEVGQRIIEEFNIDVVLAFRRAKGAVIKVRMTAVGVCREG